MLIVRAHAPDDAGPPSAELVLTFEQRSRSRLHAMLTRGEPVGLVLPRGTLLRDGDRLVTDAGEVIAVRAAEEEVIDARCDDAAALARIAYHLGNRHARVEIGPGFVRFAADPVLAVLCERLGARLVAQQRPFEPEAGAYAAGHHAHSSDARHAGIIHDMIERTRGGQGAS
ncbi:MAG TPA: urease accessory protein UreE [Casimicrobiaceae bacterium]|nr:urease accessory protein UreE [Casimicrobiaceae bacterium]